MSRELREIKIWKNGKWKKTNAIVNDKELCKYPPCNKKIPSGKSNYKKKKGPIPKGYCTKDHWEAHKNNEHLKPQLNEFFQETG